MRAVLPALLALLAGCPPAAPRPPGPPAAPVLVGTAEVQRRRLFLLRGAATDEVVVRLFADTACAGPVLLETTGPELREGVTVELVAGADNVFSANAVSSRGLTSDCSAPVPIPYVPSPRPGLPSVSSVPPSPSNALRFSLVGAADLGARVRLHEGSCDAPVLAELSATEFFDPGFTVELAPDSTRFFAVNAANEDVISPCAYATVTNDRTPPLFSLRLGSPTPSPQAKGWLVYRGEVEFARVHLSPDCSGSVVTTCARCVGALVDFPPDASTDFSVLSWDQAGNSTCVQGPEPWVHDPSRSEDEAVVLVPEVPMPGEFTQPTAQVAAGRGMVELFRSADCSGLVALELPAFQLIFNGLSLPGAQDAGFVTARSYKLDGGADPCSNALLLP